MVLLNKYRVTDIRKFKRFIFISVLMISLVVFALTFTVTVYSSGTFEFYYIQVKQGDTLWSLASQYDDNIEIRKMIYLIENENSIEDAAIYPGDIIRIPVY